MDLMDSMWISAAGMRAQGTRMRVVAENLANAHSTGENAGDLPYRRQVVHFRNVFDQELGGDRVEVSGVEFDPGQFPRRYEPGHPSADAEGYVLYPNVSTLVELMDMREAQRSFEANLNVIQSSRSMIRGTIQLLRA